VITFALISLFQNIHGQDTIKPRAAKEHLNELGLDMTPFIKFYLDFSDYGSGYYPANYFLTYRHYFKKGNLRSGLGGNYNYSQTPSPYNGDSLKIKYESRQKSFEFRIGYEFFQNLSKHWQVYYGADVIAGYYYLKNDAPFWNGGYANGTENETQAIGLAPVLGVRFKISNRLSLLTEANFLVQYSQRSSSRYYLPVTSAFPPKANDPKTTTKSIGTTFNSPIALILTLNI
jgi:hypothetical protein